MANPKNKPVNNFPDNKKMKFNITWIYLIIAIVLLAVWWWNPRSANPTEIDNVQFNNMVVKQDIKEVM